MRSIPKIRTTATALLAAALLALGCVVARGTRRQASVNAHRRVANDAPLDLAKFPIINQGIGPIQWVPARSQPVSATTEPIPVGEVGSITFRPLSYGSVATAVFKSGGDDIDVVMLVDRNGKKWAYCISGNPRVVCEPHPGTGGDNPPFGAPTITLKRDY